MDFSENSHSGTRPGEFGANPETARQETFVTGVYRAVDEATAGRLDRLRSEEGIIPACKLGCCYCCRYHILTNVAEAHTLAQYVRRELSAGQIDELRLRTQQWHEWENSRPGRHPSTSGDEPTGLCNYDHCCPLLVDRACIAYPVRPVACRTHFVSSDPLSCGAANDPESTEQAPAVLTSVVTAASPFTRTMRNHIENAGVDFSRSIMLLPHWLAIEMGWDFAVSP